MPDSRASEPLAGRRDALLSLDELQTAVQILDSLGVNWTVVGGQVANLYRSDVRLTRDYDFLVGSFAGLRTALEDAGFEIEIGGAESQARWARLVSNQRPLACEARARRGVIAPA